MTSLKLEKLSGIVGFFFFQIHPSTSTIVFLFYGPPVFQKFIFYVQLFLPLISIHLSKISRNLSLLSLLLLFYFYFQFTIFYTLPCWGEWNHCFSVMFVFFFLKKKKQLLSKSILLALSFPGSLAV